MNEAWLRSLEIEVQRQALVSLLVLVLVFAFVMWISYLVIKAAIRDGIRESGLIETRRASWAITARKADGQDTVPDLPDFRAER